MTTVGAGPSTGPLDKSAKLRAAEREEGYQRRRTERQAVHDAAREVTSVKRLRHCGVVPAFRATGVTMKCATDGVGYINGLQTCGNAHYCASCAAKIRQQRADDVMEGATRWVEQGGGALFVTVTMPHHAGEGLAPLIDVLMTAWQGVARQRSYRELVKSGGKVGDVVSLEVTRGPSGWHPHRHMLVLFDAPVGAEVLARYSVTVHALWNEQLNRLGHRPSKFGVGVNVQAVRLNAGAVGAYLAKLQEGTLGMELARADLKASRGESVKPFELLDGFRATGDLDDPGVRLWREYERAMRGRSSVRFSRGLRSALGLVKEQTDEELAAAEVGGDDVAVIAFDCWQSIVRRRGVQDALRAAAGLRSIERVRQVVAAFGGDPGRVYEPVTTSYELPGVVLAAV